MGLWQWFFGAEDPSGIAVEDPVRVVLGSGGKTREVPQIAFEEDLYGFFEGVGAFGDIAGEPGVELGAPVRFDEDEEIELRAQLLVGGDFAVADQATSGTDGFRLVGFARRRVENGAMDSPS